MKAAGDLADVGLHFVAAVVLEYREGGFCPLIAKASQSAPPDLRVSGEDSFSNKTRIFFPCSFHTAEIHKYISFILKEVTFLCQQIRLKHHQKTTMFTSVSRNNFNSD